MISQSHRGIKGEKTLFMHILNHKIDACFACMHGEDNVCVTDE